MSSLQLFLFGFLIILSESPLTNAFINVGDSSSSSSDEDETVESSNGLDESNDESLYTFTYADDLELKQGQFVGRVTIGESFSLSFDLELSEKHGDYWATILHIGTTNTERSPGIWLYPDELVLHIRFSDIDNYNTGYDIDEELSLDTVYNVKLTVTADGTITSYLDGVAKATTHNTVFLSRFEAPIFVGDPWYYPAIGSISNIEIGPYDGEMHGNNSNSNNNNNNNNFGQITNNNIDRYTTNIENKMNKMDNFEFNDFSMFWKIIIISGAVFLSVSMFLIANRALMMSKNNKVNPYTSLL